MRAHRAAAAGFTLVEVLVALLVMSLLAVMAWQGIDGMVRARDASQQRLEATLRLNTALAQWQQDLLSVQQTPVVPGLRFDGAALQLACWNCENFFPIKSLTFELISLLAIRLE